MGLVSTLLNYSRQAEQDEMRKRMFEAEMADRGRRIAREKESRAQEEEYLSGVSKLMDLKMDASQKKMEAMQAQAEGNRMFAAGDPNAGLMLGRASALAEAASAAEEAMPIIKKTIFMNALRDNKQVQNAFAASIANDLGVNPKDVAPSTVKVKYKTGGGVSGEPETEYTYDAPADSLNSILPQGAARPAMRQQPTSLQDQLNLNSLYQSSMGSGVSTMSTGEQPVNSSMLFGGNQQQAQASPNPFIQTKQPAKRKRYNEATQQLESY
jgi:hypothetical protein